MPNDALRTIAAALAAGPLPLPRGVAFVHASGATGLDSLAALGGRHALGSFHPLQSFPEPRPPDSLRGIVVGVDATTPVLLGRLERLARAVGATPKRVLDADRVTYHTAAVLASNYLAALVAEAVHLLAGIGWSEKQALAALVPLAEGTLANVRKRGAVGALTGPVRRGDVPTVRRHLAALDGLAGRSGKARGGDLYRMLGLLTLGIAEQAGLDPAAAGRMRRALTQKAAATQRRRRA